MLKVLTMFMFGVFVAGEFAILFGQPNIPYVACHIAAILIFFCLMCWLSHKQDATLHILASVVCAVISLTYAAELHDNSLVAYSDGLRNLKWICTGIGILFILVGFNVPAQKVHEDRTEAPVPRP